MSRSVSLGGESFEDLDDSLENALNSVTNNLFRYTDGSVSPARGSQGSLGAIPLASMGEDGRERSWDSPRQDDNSPLMPDYGHNRTLSTGSLNLNSNGFATNSQRIFQGFLDFFRGAQRGLRQDKLKRAGATDYRDMGGIRSSTERHISPRSGTRASKTRSETYPSNAISNAKYNPITFIPVVLYEQFKFFFNLYFLLVALSQTIPRLRIGYLSSYIVPLSFVLTVTMLKEASDDIKRRKRDKEQNNELYEVLLPTSTLMGQDSHMVMAKDLKVGDIVQVNKGSRVPADMVLLQSSEKDSSGEAFIKTDQLDGETDWKLRIACHATQPMTSMQLLNNITLVVGNPAKNIHQFNGKIMVQPQRSRASFSSTNEETFPLSVDQTLWANTVLASSSVIGFVIYTGIETRQSMNTTMSRVKTGLLELEINSLSKILCLVVLLLSVGLVLAHGFPLKSTWYIDILRFLILFSSIIPVSLRVNLDLAKSVYASQIQNDMEIPETVVRTSTIPEDLGRIEYLLSDKTGTLTQNDMEMKKLHLGTVSYAGDSLDIVSEYVRNLTYFLDSFKKRDLAARVCDIIVTLALCHNVTPTYDIEDDLSTISYQAASPDEIAIVKFTELIGLKLYKRDRQSITLLHLATNQKLNYEIKYNFPFNSETKRMGIIVKDIQRDEVWFLEKGADTVMSKIVGSNDWLDEETGNMAREGLRTLVIGRKKLSKVMYDSFVEAFTEASVSMHDREQTIQRAIGHYLEQDLELLGLTGVEDKLQKDVKTSIELLRNAGIKIWMLTGDKIETAKTVSISARLISRGQYVHTVTKVTDPEYALNHLDYLQSNTNSCLLIDGESLSTYLKYYREEFFGIVIKLPVVIACRCSPQQKADVALFIRDFTGKRVCCIGDGGNDVSMIQSADVGVGIVGKEGKQASLAADFSIEQFYCLSKLLLWHGRNSYKRSAKLAQFVMHRGLLISIAQAIYSISSKFEPLALYQGWLMVGYSTVYTMAPVFSLTLDCDVDEHLTKLYPELYRELTLGRSLSYWTFFMWVLVSLYQGSVIEILSQVLHTFSDSNTFKAMVAMSFTALILNELFMVAFSINRWNKVMSSTIVITFLLYVISIPFLTDYFDITYVSSSSFIFQVILSLVSSLTPVWVLIVLSRRLFPPSYTKVQQD